MSDLIEKQTALDAIQKRADRVDSVHSAFWEGLIIAKDIVKNIPSAEPERTAKVEHQGTTHGYWMGDCSECQNRVDSFMIFCPHCGCRLIWGDDES